MVIDKILGFFNTADAVQSKPDMDTIREFNDETDSPDSINWKKTAQTGKKMSNLFDTGRIFSGKIVEVHSDNRNMGIENNAYNLVHSVIKTLHKKIGNNNGMNIDHSTISRIPSFQHPFTQKTIIISDFLWSKKDIAQCIKTCKENKTRCIVIPLIGQLGVIKHPLISKYPQYFWAIDM